MDAALVNEVRVFVVSTIYALLGMVLLFIGYRALDWMTPSDMQKKIFEEGNVAVAVLAGSLSVNRVETPAFQAGRFQPLNGMT